MINFGNIIKYLVYGIIVYLLLTYVPKQKLRFEDVLVSTIVIIMSVIMLDFIRLKTKNVEGFDAETELIMNLNIQIYLKVFYQVMVIFIHQVNLILNKLKLNLHQVRLNNQLVNKLHLKVHQVRLNKQLVNKLHLKLHQHQHQLQQ